MKTLIPIALLTALLPFFFATDVVAQDNDLLGVFFDETGDQSAINTTEQAQVVPFYLVLLNPSHIEGIHSWECILEVLPGNDPVPIISWEFAGDAVNANSPPRFLVSLATPLPAADAVVLVTGEAFVVYPESEALFYLHPFDPPSLENPPGDGYPVTTPAYGYGEGNLQSLGWASGCEAEPVARINDDGDDPVWSLGGIGAEIFFDPVPAGEMAWEDEWFLNTGEVAISGQIEISGAGFAYFLSGEAWTVEQQWFRLEPDEGLWVNLRVESAMHEEYTGLLEVSVCGETTAIVLVKPTAYPCVITPPSWDFGTVFAGLPAEQTFEVRNTGGQLLEGQVTIPASCAGFTVIDGAEPFSLAHDETHLFTVGFDPVEEGSQVCSVLVSADCADVELVALGVVAPECVITPPGWDFGAVWVGEPAQQTFEVRNTGGAQLEGQVMIPASCSGFTLVDGGEPFSLLHDENHYFIIEFVPVEWGLHECDALVSAECADVELLGFGVVPTGDCWYYQTDDAAIVGSVDTPGNASGVAVEGNIAYVADGGSGLQVVDVTDPQDPVIVGSEDTPGSANSVAVSGNYAYVADGGSGLQIVDIMIPDNPHVDGSAELPEFHSARDVAVSGICAYVTSGYGPFGDHGSLHAINITIPTSPQILGSVIVDTSLDRLVVVGNYAYVTGYKWYPPGVIEFYLLVINNSDPQSLFVTDSQNLGWAASSLASDLTVSGDYLFVAGLGDLWIFDLSDPSNPWLIGSLETPGYTACVAVAGSFAYLGEYENDYLDGGLQVVDISVPEFPMAVGWMDLPERSRGIEINEQWVYIASSGAGLHIAWQQCPYPVAIEGDPEEPGADGDIPIAGLRLAVHPNPFNPHTTVAFSLPYAEWADVSVYDLTGRLVNNLTNRSFTPGPHTLTWNGRDDAGRAIPSGTYIVRLETDSGVEARKVMLIR